MENKLEMSNKVFFIQNFIFEEIDIEKSGILIIYILVI